MALPRRLQEVRAGGISREGCVIDLSDASEIRGRDEAAFARAGKAQERPHESLLRKRRLADRAHSSEHLGASICTRSLGTQDPRLHESAERFSAVVRVSDRRSGYGRWHGNTSGYGHGVLREKATRTFGSETGLTQPAVESSPSRADAGDEDGERRQQNSGVTASRGEKAREHGTHRRAALAELRLSGLLCQGIIGYGEGA